MTASGCHPDASDGGSGPGPDNSEKPDSPTHLRPSFGRGNVLVPTGSRRAALAGIALLTRSRPAALACQWLLYGAVAAAGPRIVPGARVEWHPPCDAARWHELAARLSAVLGPFDELAVYERPQASRGGTGIAATLLRAGRPAGFLKLRPDPSELDREERALAAFPGGLATGFRVPRVLGRGAVADWHWMIIEAMPPRPARPPYRPRIEAIAGQVQERLAASLPRPAGTPPHWRPMHGDLTVWNLRKCGPGPPWLIDWEDAAWAPPGADLVYYAATSAAVYGGPVFSGPVFGGSPLGAPAKTTEPAEAVEFWLRRVAGRSDADDDAAFKTRLTGALRAMNGR